MKYLNIKKNICKTGSGFPTYFFSKIALVDKIFLK